ncbi:hypothetical protein [Deinococcus sp. Marseille-Q6407]|uniref:hypothetical protein n=1 Tax=Deinococcus sp. Marseille-Q6407 TaxID=2969223 RepID=UPI0021C08AE3|nr:hypothetical protein [Deinococcus sp. Marseille-Q6407]
MRLPLPFPIALAVVVPLLLGGIVVPLAYGFGHPARRDIHVWRPLASTPAWAGYELAAVDIADFDSALILRCAERPQRKLERGYWPGAGGWGGEEVAWTQEKVTLSPRSGSKARPYAFRLAEAGELSCH